VLSSVGKVILGMLQWTPRSGYDVKTVVDRSTRFFWAASYGQIYPELRRLERDGLIAGERAGEDGRRRRAYRLTRRGRARLRAWLLAPEAGYELRDEGLLKLFFADALEPEEALAVLRALRADRQAVADKLRQVRREHAHVLSRRPFPSLVLEYGIEQHEWMVDWCRRAERRLASRSARRAAAR
jgi:DNA-binding PadR family transcriptional regulator